MILYKKCYLQINKQGDPSFARSDRSHSHTHVYENQEKNILES